MYGIFAVLYSPLLILRRYSREGLKEVICIDSGKVDRDSHSYAVEFLMYLQSRAIRPPDMIVRINSIGEFGTSTS